MKKTEEKEIISTFSGKEMWSNQGEYCSYKHITERQGDEIIFKASIKININTKKGRKLLKKVIEKQSSPIKTHLQEFDSNNKKDREEGKPHYDYVFPESIMEKIYEDDKK